MLFKVKFTDDLGVAKTQFLSAYNQETVERHPAFTGTLISLKKLPDFLEGFLIKKLSLESQLLLMSQVAAAVNSGGDINGVREIITSIPELVKIESDPRFRHASTITDYLEICNVDTVTIMLVKAGEESGRLAESTEEAVIDISKRIELKQATKGDITKGVFYMVAGFAMVIGLSIMLNQVILEMMAGDRLDVNFGTHIMIFLNDAFTKYFLVTASLMAGAYFLFRYLWTKYALFRDIPAVKIYNNYRKVVRSLNFLSTWRPLFLSGVPMMAALNQVRDGMSGLDKHAMDLMLEDIRLGSSIGKSLHKDYWSTAFRIGLKPFDSANDDAKRLLLFRIQELLQIEMKTLGKKLGTIMLGLGMAGVTIGILLMAFGFYMPMLSGMKMF